ncbi:MAG: hypothetical protein DME60_09850 [Verrucomicrobia bacterium]|nr:MAG: hypothetical protein DME60_09850 [Verrucomicrobiota bacterium]
MTDAVLPTYLSSLVTDLTQRLREAVKRRRAFEFETISEAQLAEYESLGWSLDKKLIKKAASKTSQTPR